jgi:hypothetical protein
VKSEKRKNLFKALKKHSSNLSGLCKKITDWSASVSPAVLPKGNKHLINLCTGKRDAQRSSRCFFAQSLLFAPIDNFCAKPFVGMRMSRPRSDKNEISALACQRLALACQNFELKCKVFALDCHVKMFTYIRARINIKFTELELKNFFF